MSWGSAKLRTHRILRRQRCRGEFRALLKDEIGTRIWPDRATARAEVFDFVETFYNRRRLRKHKVFLADRETMQSPARALPALSTVWEDESELDPVYYQELIELPEPREFRVVPAAVHGVQVDLAPGNVSFAEYAGAASEEPDSVLRPV